MKRHETGATLIEMIVTVAITGAVVSAAAAAVTTGMRTTASVEMRLVHTNSAQILSRFFVPDVQSADDVSTTDATCGGSGTLVRLRRIDTSVTDVAYAVKEFEGVRRLVRTVCTETTATSRVLEPELAGSGTAAACVPDAACPGRPTRVVLTVAAKDTPTYTISGTRKAS
ncbi:MAG TPA: prepilin-type N-terminal cleavage/methylation domain-containing protein [Actinomycetota bacterium]|nr:prepilin-type N-terminal cleavage/methylation domain-containing protein [Actinomycetota bacterium]